MKYARIFLTAAFMMVSFCAFCQDFRPPFPGGERPEGMPEHAPKQTAKQRAECRTNEMDKLLDLDQKQYKKIYNIFLKEENAKDSALEGGFPMGPPPGGMGAGMPPQGGGFPGGAGMGGSFPGAGGPPSGMPFPGDFGEPRKPAVNGKEIDSDEYIDEREEKFRKILTPQQYSTLRRIHPDPSGFFVK